MSEIQNFHDLAKDAGNRLRAYILSVSSGGTGVFFLALTKTEGSSLQNSEKWLLGIALISFVITVALCLYELRIDAKRFFSLAKEHEKLESERSWEQNDKYKNRRYCLIHLSYVTLGIAIITTSLYLVIKIIDT